VLEAFRLLDAFDADKFKTAEPGSQSPFTQAGTAPQQNAGAVQSPAELQAQVAGQNQSTTAGEQATQVNVTVEGDSGVIKDVAAEAITEQELAAIRGTGGTQRP